MAQIISHTMSLSQTELQGYFNAWKDQYDPRLNDVENALKANQPIIDGLVSNTGQGAPIKQKTFGAALAEQLREKKDQVDEFQMSKHNKLTLEIKDTMTTSFSLTGDPMMSYANQPAIAPGHLINFRNLIPTTPSPTGTFVTYREDEYTNSFSNQTENDLKGEQNYSWSEIRAESNYLSATSTFTKQLMYKLGFVSTTLANQLLRDLYIKENNYFYDLTAAAALGSNYTTATVDAESLIDLISNQLAASFVPSYAIVHPTQWARLLKTKPSDYSVPAGFVINSQGQTTVAGVPVIPAAWADHDKVLLFDANEIERCETESLRVEFSFQSGEDWIRNRVTARCEVFETLNFKRPESIIWLDMGNS